MYITVGTAGHIDHGKTLLIKALTGIDADRLPEEKQRGISIDLGFAELELEGVRIGFVDVPGHEKFVKNMLAGASGIDLVLFVIAADEGVMPQTREHFEICRLLGIRKGIVVLTKADKADPEVLELARTEAEELVAGSFLDGAPVFAVSSRTGTGIDDLKTALVDSARAVESRESPLVTRLPIDRSFTVKGFGTVVTGTLASGRIEVGDELELLPDGRDVRVRGLQAHGKDVKTVDAGQRAAVNLGGISHHDVSRGMLLSQRRALRPNQIINTETEALKGLKKSIKSRQRVRLHIGTKEVLSRILVLNQAGEVEQGNKAFTQFRLEAPIAAVPGERFIIRSYSPAATIGGGVVLDGLAKKARKKDSEAVAAFLKTISDKQVNAAEIVSRRVVSAGSDGMDSAEMQARTGWQMNFVEEALRSSEAGDQIIKAGGTYIGNSVFATLKENAKIAVADHFRKSPLSPGMPLETLRERTFAYVPNDIFRTVVSDLINDKVIVADKELIRLAGRDTELSAEDSAIRQRLLKVYTDAGIEPPKLEEALAASTEGRSIARNHARTVFQLLLTSGEIVKVSDEFYFLRSVIDGLVKQLTKFDQGKHPRFINVSKFKELAGISRKYAIPLLEYFDREKTTMRVGDQRQILK